MQRLFSFLFFFFKISNGKCWPTINFQGGAIETNLLHTSHFIIIGKQVIWTFRPNRNAESLVRKQRLEMSLPLSWRSRTLIKIVGRVVLGGRLLKWFRESFELLKTHIYPVSYAELKIWEERGRKKHTDTSIEAQMRRTFWKIQQIDDCISANS